MDLSYGGTSYYHQKLRRSKPAENAVMYIRINYGVPNWNAKIKNSNLKTMAFQISVRIRPLYSGTPGYACNWRITYRNAGVSAPVAPARHRGRPRFTNGASKGPTPCHGTPPAAAAATAGHGKKRTRNATVQLEARGGHCGVPIRNATIQYIFNFGVPNWNWRLIATYVISLFYF